MLSFSIRTVELSKSVCPGLSGIRRRILVPSSYVHPSSHRKVSRLFTKTMSEPSFLRQGGERWLLTHLHTLPRRCGQQQEFSQKPTLTPLSSSSLFAAWRRQPASHSRAMRKPRRMGRWRPQPDMAARKEKAANATAGPEGELVLLVLNGLVFPVCLGARRAVFVTAMLRCYN